MHPRASQCLWLLRRSREGALQSRRSERRGRLRRSVLCRAQRGLRAQARVSSRDRPDHPLVSLLVVAKTIDTPRKERVSAETIDRPLQDCCIFDRVLALRTSRDTPHESIVARCHVALAGEGGFEPPNGGSKGRCLTTWRLPINGCCEMNNYECRRIREGAKSSRALRCWRLRRMAALLMAASRMAS